MTATRLIRRGMRVSVPIAAMVAAMVVPAAPAGAAPGSQELGSASPGSASPGSTLPAGQAGSPAFMAGSGTLVNGTGKVMNVGASSVAASASIGASTGGANGRTGAKAPRSTAGPARPDTVIGPDGRRQRTATTTYPHSAVVHIETSSGTCSGFMLSHDTVVTAAHCVFDFHGTGTWVSSFRVIPGRNGAAEPFGSCTGTPGDEWVPADWINTGDALYDLGMLKLTCDIGNSTGWFGWWFDEGESLVNKTFTTEGYPGDKAYGTMWWDSDVVTFQTLDNLWYNMDTAGGQSGSAIFRNGSTAPGLCGGWCVTGIVTNHAVPGGSNLGRRFNSYAMGHINFVIGLP